MLVQLKEWGNGQGIRFGKEFLSLADARVNDYFDAQIVEGDIILRRTHKHRSLEERAREYGNRLGPYEEYDWGEPVGREQW